MALFGFSIELALLPMLHNLWCWFPDSKGTVSGLALCCYGLSASVFDTLAGIMINPDNLLPNSEGIFPDEVAENTHQYFIALVYIFLILGSIGCSLVFHAPKEAKLHNTEHLIANKEPIMQGIKSRPFACICIISFCTMCKYEP